MMERRIGAPDARRQLDSVLSNVAGQGDTYVVERHGEAVAALVPMHVYEAWKRSREAFFDRLAQTAALADMGEEAGMALALEAQRAARAAARPVDA